MSKSEIRIKKCIESDFDLPFVVQKQSTDNGPSYLIIPAESVNDLFVIRITFKDSIRLIVEVNSQDYSKYMLADMQDATEEQRKDFLNYISLIKQAGFSIRLSTGNEGHAEIDCDIWNNEWQHFSLRATKVPISQEDYIEEEIVIYYSELFIGTVLSLLNVVSISDEAQKNTEGAKTKALVNKYERNPVNRRLCLNANGCECAVCGLNFESNYGEIGKGFIHVHHIVPISSIGHEYMIDPVHDLVPVCPNCHAMLHRKNPPYSIEELKNIILSVSETKK